MEFDPSSMERRDVYKIMASCIIPRPIAWVSTQDKAGINNLAPFSFFNGVSSTPPSLSVSISYNRGRADGRKDTLQNILDVREFVVNIVTDATARAMVESSADHPPDVDEFALTNLTPTECKTVRVPRVAESPVSFECSLYATLQVGEGPGSSTLVIGVVQYFHVRDDLLTEQGDIDMGKVQVVGRSYGNGYCTVRDSYPL